MRYFLSGKPMLSFASATLFLVCIIATSFSWATGPRISKSLLSNAGIDHIYTVDFPPFSTTSLKNGGMSNEIINAVCESINANVALTMLPLQSMVNFYLLHEKSLAIYGRNLVFNTQQEERLIYIPFAISSEQYIYYKPAYKQGLSWDGQLTSLKGFSYGVNKGENTVAYKQADIRIEYGRNHALLKKIIAKEIDFMMASELNFQWMINKHFPNEGNNFSAIKNSRVNKPIFMVFNKDHENGALMANKFKIGLSKIIESGQYLKIIEKFILKKDARSDYMAALNKQLKNHQ